MAYCSLGRIRSRNHESLKEIEGAIRFLKRKEKTDRFRLKDKDCKEAVEKVLKCLRELTRTEPEDFQFRIIEKEHHDHLLGEVRTLRESQVITQRGADELSEGFEREKIRHENSISRLRGEKEEKERYARRLQETVDSQKKALDESIQREDCLITENEGLRKELEKLRKQLDDVEIAKRRLEHKERTSAKHRQLDDNLRREDCPLNVADKMSELYDNQWTSAMKNLESLIIQEEERIGILLKIFQTIFDTCAELSERHLESFPDLLVLPPTIYQLQSEKKKLRLKEVSYDLLNQMRGFRKSNAENAALRLQKYFVEKRTSLLPIKDKVFESCKEYIGRCVELCWMMHVQDTPIYMETGYPTNSTFDGNQMRSYTKTGRLVHFVVWPTFFVQKDGPLLAKGIVQGSNTTVIEEKFSHWDADETDEEEYFDAQSSIKSENDDKVDNNHIKKSKEPFGLA